MSDFLAMDALNAPTLEIGLERAEHIPAYQPYFRAMIYWLFDDFDKAHIILDKQIEIAVSEGRPDEEFLAMVIKGMIYQHQGNLEQLQDCYEQAELISSINSFEDIEFRNLWFALYHRLSALVFFADRRLPEASSAINTSIDFLEMSDCQIIREWILFDTGKIYKEMNRYNISLSYFHELLSNGIDETFLNMIYREMIDIHQNQGNLNISLYYLYKLIKSKIAEQNNIESISIYTRIASIFLSKGMYEEAESIIKITQKLYQDIGDDKGEIWSKFQLAISEFRKGHWKEALKLFEESQDRLLALPDRNLQGLVLKFIGDIKRLRGDLAGAKEIFNQSITLFNELQDRWNLADLFNRLGLVYFQEGENKIAHKNFQKSLAIFRKIGDSVRYSEPIFNLIRTKLDLQSQEQAQTFLDMLRNVSDRTDNELVHQRERLATALVLKNKHRIVDKVAAQKILTEFIEGPIIDAELSILGMINLCDLLLAELHLYQHPEVLEEILRLSDRLIDISVEQRSQHVQIEALILKSRLSLISGEIDKTSSLLEQAKEIAQNANLSLQSERIESEQNQLMSQLREWNYLNKKSASIRDRMEILEIQNYMESILMSK